MIYLTIDHVHNSEQLRTYSDFMRVYWALKECTREIGINNTDYKDEQSDNWLEKGFGKKTVHCVIMVRTQNSLSRRAQVELDYAEFRNWKIFEIFTNTSNLSNQLYPIM